MQNSKQERGSLVTEVADVWNSLPNDVLKAESLCGLKQRLDKFTEDISSEGYQIYRATSGSGSPWTENSWRLGDYWGKYHVLALFWLFSRRLIKAPTGGRIWGCMNPSSDLIQPCLCSNYLFAIHVCVLWESNENLVCKVLSNKCKQPKEAVTPWLPKAGRPLRFLKCFP